MKKLKQNKLLLQLLFLVLIAFSGLNPAESQQKQSSDQRGKEERENIVVEPEGSKNPITPQNIKTLSEGTASPNLNSDSVDNLQDRLNKHIESQNAKDDPKLFNVGWLQWVVGISSLISVASSISSLVTLKKVDSIKKNLTEKINSLKSNIDIGDNLDFQILKSSYHKLATDIEDMKLALKNLQDEKNLSKTMNTPTPKTSPVINQFSSTTDFAKFLLTTPDPQSPEGPEPVGKRSLITALNSGDSKTLRDIAAAELNITSESENDVYLSRAVATQLEEVAGGGSFLLVSLEGKHWLFPTDRTLKGFAAAQPAKGLFNYEQKTIAHPQLVEPAQLESNGAFWRVVCMGSIGIP